VTATPRDISGSAGRYQLMERIGAGGMAEVWRANLTGPAGFRRAVVVKRVLPHFAEEPAFNDMFLSEARILARLHHASIVQVLDFGVIDDHPFLAMELLHGRTLTEVMRAQMRAQGPDPGLAAFVARDVCRALAYAHDLKDDGGAPLCVLHRDVSPGNIMVGYDGSVKLLDFGIAKLLDATRARDTESGVLKGKIAYMAPERLDGNVGDHRADLYSVGVVLHESLTGQRLFAGERPAARAAPVPPPSRSDPEIPAALDEICRRALAADPRQRYAHAGQMVAELEAVLHQLQFGPQRLSEALATLLPPDAQRDDDERTETPTRGPAGASSEPLPPRARPRWPRALLLGGLGVVGIGWLVHTVARSPARHDAPSSQGVVTAPGTEVERAASRELPSAGPIVVAPAAREQGPAEPPSRPQLRSGHRHEGPRQPAHKTRTVDLLKEKVVVDPFSTRRAPAGR
jgi:serine/threonine-protein kinase